MRHTLNGAMLASRASDFNFQRNLGDQAMSSIALSILLMSYHPPGYWPTHPSCTSMLIGSRSSSYEDATGLTPFWLFLWFSSLKAPLFEPTSPSSLVGFLVVFVMMKPHMSSATTIKGTPISTPTPKPMLFDWSWEDMEGKGKEVLLIGVELEVNVRGFIFDINSMPSRRYSWWLRCHHSRGNIRCGCFNIWRRRNWGMMTLAIVSFLVGIWELTGTPSGCSKHLHCEHSCWNTAKNNCRWAGRIQIWI